MQVCFQVEFISINYELARLLINENVITYKIVHVLITAQSEKYLKLQFKSRS